MPGWEQMAEKRVRSEVEKTEEKGGKKG